MKTSLEILADDRASPELDLLADAAERSPEVRQALVDLLEHGGELIRLDWDDSQAVGAGQLRVRVQLADGLAELARAVRAGEFDRQHKVDLSDVRQRLTNANSPGLYVPTKTWQRPGSDHSHIKSRGAI